MKLPTLTLMLVTQPCERLYDIVDSAVAGGVNVVQVRDKTADQDQLLETARCLRAITAGRVLLIVNGSAEVALEADADGVHLPEQGQSVALARAILGNDALIGRSVHSLESALCSGREGADYLVAGAIFRSASHPDEEPAGVNFLRSVCDVVSIPVLAIGGVTPGNAADCLSVGSAGIAVLSPIMQAKDPRTIAERYRFALLPSPAIGGEGTRVGAT